MSEGILILLITLTGSGFTTAITLTWGIAKAKEALLKEINKEFNNLENSVIEINAKIDLITNSYDHEIKNLNSRVTNLKNNTKSRVQDLKHSHNELINYIDSQLKPPRPFIERSRDGGTIGDFDEDEWTQING